MPFEVRTTRGIEVAAIVPSSGMVTLEIGQDLEQIGLELLVRAVDLVDEEDRRLLGRIAARSGRSSRYLSEKICGLDRFGATVLPSCALIARSWRW